MEKITIHCPSCKGKLDVPPNAIGKAARCPVCKSVFKIPVQSKPTKHETVDDWLNVDDDDDDDIPPPPGTPEGFGTTEKDSPLTSVDDDDPLADLDLDLDLKLPDPKAEDTLPYPGSSSPARNKKDDPVGINISKDKETKSPEKSSAFKPGDTQKIDLPPDVKLPGTITAADSQAASNPILNHDISDIIKSEELLLYVTNISTNGIRIGFNSHWMRHLPFRASMPFECIACGESNSEKLLSRPLAWMDKAGGHFIDPSQLESKYEHPVPTHQTPREIVSGMRHIEELPPPFKDPMPYFVCNKCSKDIRIHCETLSTEKGIGCEIVIPNGQYALQWLGRVNGVCGEDYLTLEEVVVKMSESGWRELPENVRNRIAAWFDFKNGEQFIHYFKDCDFPKSDSGLGGIVLSDQRIVYCKYHSQGEVKLNATGYLQGIDNGRALDIKWIHDGKTRKTNVLLNREDAGVLRELLKQLESSLQLKMN